MMKNLWAKTVWHERNVLHIPLRYQALYRVVLPVVYFAVAMYGVATFRYNIESFDVVFGMAYGDLWSIAVAVSGVGALIGVSFYARMIWLEVVSAVLMVTLLVIYAASVPIATIISGEPFRELILIRSLIFLPVPAWRILDIVRELRPARHV